MGAGVSMATAGAMVAGNPFGETPKSWATRQAQQHGGEWVRQNVHRLPQGLKPWQVVALPTAVGTVGGGLIGAISGYRKGKNPWHASREHTNAVNTAFDRVYDLEHGRDVNRRHPNQRHLTAKHYNSIIPKR